MSRRRTWIAVSVLIGLVGVGVGTYFAWGARLEAEYERRVEALRERGEYSDQPRSWYAEIPTEENAALVLMEAAELMDKLQEEDKEAEGVLSQFTLRGWDSEWHAPGDYERLRRDWPKVRGYFAKLQEAGRRPVFAPPQWTLVSAAPFCGIQDVCQLLQVRARVEPDMAPESVQLLLNLADRWRPDGAVEMRLRFTVRCIALEVLHGGLRDGTLDVAPHRQMWDRQLAGRDVVATLREILRYRRMEEIRFMEELRQGLDPYAGLLKKFEEAQKKYEEVRKVSKEGMANEPDLGRMREHLERPWYARWYGRPVLHWKALKVLDEAEVANARATSVTALREALRDAHGSRGGLEDYFQEFALALEHLAELRLARIAMAIQVDAKTHGRPRPSLAAYAPVLGEAPLEDPFTGKPFRYERHEDRAVVSCWVAWPEKGGWESLRSRLFEGWHFEELLVWEVRWAPRDQGD